MSAAPEPPLPFTEDIDTGGFWRLAAEGKLSVRTCSACGTLLHLPKLYCHECGSWESDWREIEPTGTLHTWTVAVQQLHPAFPAPYTVVLVDLDGAPGARLIGHIAGAPDLQAGMPMRAIFHEAEPGVTLVQWEPITELE
jgi:hypothetical protein